MTAPIEDNELREQLLNIFADSPVYDGDLVVDDLVRFIDVHTARKETEAQLDEIHDLALGLNQNILQEPVYRRRVEELEQKLKNTASTP